MATVTVSVPEQMKDWAETQVRTGKYASIDDYLCDLIRRDRAGGGQDWTLEELQARLAASRASGVSDRTIDEVFARAEQIAKTRYEPGQTVAIDASDPNRGRFDPTRLRQPNQNDTEPRPVITPEDAAATRAELDDLRRRPTKQTA